MTVRELLDVIQTGEYIQIREYDIPGIELGSGYAFRDDEPFLDREVGFMYSKPALSNKGCITVELIIIVRPEPKKE